VNDRDLGRDRAIEVHYDLFGVKGVVIVGVIPVDRAGRYKPFLIGGGRIGQRLDRRLTNFRIIEVQLAVSCDDVLASIGDQKIIERVVRIIAIGGDLESEAIDLALPLSSQLSVYILEEVIKSVPGLWNVLDLVSRLLDQRQPCGLAMPQWYRERRNSLAVSFCHCNRMRRSRSLGVFFLCDR
jgi:hypothetical protein